MKWLRYLLGRLFGRNSIFIRHPKSKGRGGDFE
jgi:hypothetical protein